MSITRKRLPRRILALIMAALIMLSLTPAGLAVGEGGAGSTSGDLPKGSPSSSSDSWKFNDTSTDQFTRYTLVRVAPNNWIHADSGSDYHTYYPLTTGGNNYGTNYYVIGSVDVSRGLSRTGLAKSVGSQWLNTNAIAYASYGATSGADSAAEFIKYGCFGMAQWANQSISASNIGTIDSATLWGDNHFITTSEFSSWASAKGFATSGNINLLDIACSSRQGAFDGQSDIFDGLFWQDDTSGKLYYERTSAKSV